MREDAISFFDKHIKRQKSLFFDINYYLYPKITEKVHRMNNANNMFSKKQFQK